MRRIGLYFLIAVMATALTACSGETPKAPLGNGGHGGDNGQDDGNGSKEPGTEPLVELPTSSEFDKALQEAISTGTDTAFADAAALSGEAEVAKLIKTAKNVDNSPSVRETALSILAAVKGIEERTGFSDKIKELLNDREKRIRVATGNLLMKIGFSESKVAMVVVRLGGGLADQKKALENIESNPGYFLYKTLAANAMLDELTVDDAAFQKGLLRALVAVGIESERVAKALVRRYVASDEQGKTEVLGLMARYATKSDYGFDSLRELYLESDTMGRRKLVKSLVKVSSEKVLAKVFTIRLFAKEDDKDLREMIIELLAKTKDDGSTTVLNGVLESNAPGQEMKDYPESVALAAEALAIVGDNRSVDALLDILAHNKRTISWPAYESLQSLTGVDLPFSPSSPESPRQIQDWKDWWNKQSGSVDIQGSN